MRRLSDVLLAVLVVAIVAALAWNGYRLQSIANDATAQSIAKVQQALVQAEHHRLQAEQIARRSARLDARRLRLSILLETCVLVRAATEQPHRCDRVTKRARHLVRIIRRFRKTVVVRLTGEDGGGAGTSTVTRTATISATTVTPPPTVGSSDQCPPNNPHCEEGP